MEEILNAINKTISELCELCEQLNHSYMEEIGLPDTVEAKRSFLETRLAALRILRIEAEDIMMGYSIVSEKTGVAYRKFFQS